MRELPPFVEKVLSTLGFNTNRLKWKLHYWEEARRKKREVAQRQADAPKYKNCIYCNELAKAEDKVCKCGRRLPSYTEYQIRRFFAVDRPETTIVSTWTVGLIVVMYGFSVLLYGMEGLIGPKFAAVIDFGALQYFLVTEDGYWRLFGFALVHGGLLHIVFNSMALSQMLPKFELDIGRWRTILLITVTQLGAAGAVMWAQHRALDAQGFLNILTEYSGDEFDTESIIQATFGLATPTVGASGIAFGLIGFGLAYAHRLGRLGERAFFTQWLIYGLIFTFLIPGISKAGHIGGLVAGLPLGYWMAGRDPGRVGRRVLQWIGVACLALWIVSIYFLFANVAEHYRQRMDEEKVAQVERAPDGQGRIPNLSGIGDRI